MKKNKISTRIILTCCAAALFAMPAYAAVITTTGTIADGGAGPGIQVKLSPGVNLNYALDATGSGFALNTQNSSVKFDTTAGAIQIRNEYGIASDYAGYYMRPAAADALAAPGAADSSAFGTDDNWVKQ